MASQVNKINHYKTKFWRGDNRRDGSWDFLKLKDMSPSMKKFYLMLNDDDTTTNNNN